MAEVVTISPRKLGGTINCMPSKSVSHRMAIGALLAGNSCVDNIGISNDIRATLQAMAALGYPDFSLEGHCLTTHSSVRQEAGSIPRVVDCDESGSTLRFLIPMAMDGIKTIFRGRGRLMQRSMSVYQDLCASHRICFQQKKDEIIVDGKLSYGLFNVRGDVSSQFISGLLFVLPMLRGASVIQVLTNIESKAYIDLTLEAMAQFGVHVMWQGEHTLHIMGEQIYQPKHVAVEGDYSHAAFLLAAGLLGNGSIVENLRHDSRQGDRAVVAVLRQMGADIKETNHGYAIQPSKLKGCEVDVSQIPDLMPILSVVACAAEGDTRFFNAARLRDKECDRLSAMATELTTLGANVEEGSDYLLVHGNPSKRLRGGHCQGHNDHRIVMSLAIAATLCDDAILISDAWSVTKSAPDFWNEYQQLGGSFVIQ